MTSTEFIVHFQGQRYNIAPFVERHPGGKGLLVGYENLDIEDAMFEADHSDHAYAVLEQYLVMDDNYTVPSSANGSNTLVSFDPLKPALPQIMVMEPDKYLKWVLSRPHLDTFTIFDNPTLEACSRYPWWCVLAWWPVVGYLTWRSVVVDGTVFSVAMFLLGVLTWTLVEYALHRHLFHMIPKSRAGVAVHFFAHGIHHLIPQDPTRLVVPPLPQAILGAAFFLIFYALFMTLSLPGHAVFFAGFGFMYTIYDSLHYAFHHLDCSLPILRSLKSYHIDHHYKNEHSNYGVSTPLWDYVFGSTREHGAHHRSCRSSTSTSISPTQSFDSVV